MKRVIKHTNPVIATSLDQSDLAQWAEDIANEIADFLNTTGRLPDREDYFDDEDMGDIGRTYDALIDFSDAWRKRNV